MDNGKELKKLMKAAKRGDKRAFEKIYNLYYVPVFRYVYYRINEKKEAEDITQSVFIKVYKNIDNFKERETSPASYFFTIARNAVIDYWRKKKPILMENGREMKIRDTKNAPTENYEKEELEGIVESSLKELTDDQKDVIIMRFINEMPYKDIAAMMNKSEQAVRQLQSRAIKNLRVEFRKKGLIE